MIPNSIDREKDRKKNGGVIRKKGKQDKNLYENFLNLLLKLYLCMSPYSPSLSHVSLSLSLKFNGECVLISCAEILECSIRR